MKKRGLTDSFNYAIEGLKHTLKTQRNMRIHFAAGAVVVVLGIFFGLDRIDFILLLSAVTLVFVAEMFNTSIELAVDIFTKEFHHMARMAKDIAAASVLVTAVYAAIVGYLVFFKTIKGVNLSDVFLKIRQSPWHITAVSLALIVGIVVVMKSIFHRGTPLRGGMPSGHSAVGFSVFTVTAFLSDDIMVIGLVFLMAVLLAASRIRKGLHTIWEVVVGSIIGMLMTILVFQFLYRG